MDSRTRRPALRALAMCCLLLAVGTIVPVDGTAAARASRAALQGTTKDASYQRLNDLAGAISRFRELLAAEPNNTQVLNKLNLALAEYDSISVSLGGDQAAPDQSQPAAPGDGQLGAPVLPPNCVAGAPASGSNVTPVAIPDSGGPVATSTIVVAGAGTFLWDVDCTVNITHTFTSDLDLTLTSPSGTVVTLSSDNGSGNDNVFAGTTFDDDANPGGQVPYSTNAGLVNDHPYVDLTAATPLAPEEALAAFIGEDPNGTWTITIDDDAGGDTGLLNSWSLSVVTCMCMVAGPGCTLTCPADINATATDLNGAVVNYPAPTAANCINVVCTPASGSTFPIGTTVVTCTGDDNIPAGTSATCQFNINVTIPFDACCIDDASGDIFRQVVASVPATSPLYGYWEYQVAATSEIFAGIGNHVAFRPGLSIILDDTDDPAVYCHAEIDFPRRKCRVQVRDITTGRNFVLRDRNITNNMCTAAPPPAP